MKRKIILTLYTAFIAAVSFAIPAKRGFIDYTQPDGSCIKIRIVGDEHGHLVLSEDGTLLMEKEGWLQPANTDKEVYIENLKAIRNARISQRRQESLQTRSEGNDGSPEDDGRLVPLNFGRCDVSFPTTGKQKGLVILVEYQDVKFTIGDFDYFNRMLNEEGFSDFGSLGSARDWFIENSSGQFLPGFDVYGPVELPNERSYYGKNDASGNDKNPQMMAVHACELLDDEVDFSQYDRDGDGYIDNVFIFYAGIGEHDSKLSDAVWPHAWGIYDDQYKFDGVTLRDYACTCEYPNKSSRPDGIGTFVHEFSHILGLPDLYPTDDSNCFTPGEWDVLDYGPYNNDGLTPPNYSSFEKCALGWIEFLPIQEGLNELPDFSETNIAYALPTERKNEFFFFENRQQRGNDTFIPGHGMLVWHVDYDWSNWFDNTVNNKRDHQRVDIVEADNIKNARTMSGDSFPGTANVTSIGFNTAPQLASWNKKPLSFELSDISESDEGIISFNATANDENGDNAVETIDNEGVPAQYYDLMGRKVAKPGKGIYILNGKKTILSGNF